MVTWSSPATTRTRRRRRRDGRRRLAAHRRHRRARRRRVPAHHRPQEGPDHHRRREERLAEQHRGCVAQRVDRESRGDRRSAAVHRRAAHAGRVSARGLCEQARASGEPDELRLRTPPCSTTSSNAWTRSTAISPNVEKVRRWVLLPQRVRGRRRAHADLQGAPEGRRRTLCGGDRESLRAHIEAG